MSLRADAGRSVQERVRRAAGALLLLCAAFLAAVVPVAADRPNGAGIVVRHGNATLIYVYVEFEEDSITSDELLVRSGVQAIMAPYGGLGAGVCMLDGEGCPADNCFCASYTNPAYFWHFYALSDGVWVEQLRGASSRVVRDGDVDGWSWTAAESGLPPVTIDEIALLNGIDRNAPDPTATTAPPTSPPEPTSTPAPPQSETPVPLPTATMAPSIPPSPTATSLQTAPIETPAVARSAATSPPSITPTRASRVSATPTRRSAVVTATTPVATATTDAAVRAVVVEPGGTPVPLDLTPRDAGRSSRDVALFAAMAAAVISVGGLAVYRARRVGSDA